jgi:GTPase-activator protein for Ras-like GTPase
VLKKYAGSPSLGVVRYTVVSSFVFLRLFVAAINTPKLFALTRSHPTEQCARTLTLVSKAIMTLANLTEFGGKEPYMAPLNHVLKQHTPNFLAFVDNIAVGCVPVVCGCCDDDDDADDDVVVVWWCCCVYVIVCVLFRILCMGVCV